MSKNAKKPFSLRIRIFLLVLLVGILPGFFIAYGALSLYKSRSVSNDISTVKNEAKLLANQIASVGYMSDPSEAAMTTNLISVGNAYSGRIMVMDESLRVVKDTYGADEGRVVVWSNVITSAGGEATAVYDEDNSVIVVTVPIQSEVSETERHFYGVLLISKSADYITQNLNFYKDFMLEAFLLLAVLSVGLGIAAATRLTNPFHRMADAITEIKNGVNENELFINDFAETREISEHFNSFMQQMQAIDESRQEFVSNVSHELKTPLTSMKVLADSLNDMEGAPIELYKEFMSDIGNEIDRETKIINDLLSLVKLDKSGASLNISPVNLNEVCELLLKRLAPIAEKQNVELVMESFRPVTAEVDEVKFSLAIMNLVENGIKYNVDGGWVHVSLNADHQYFFIRVEDSGMGIPQDSIDRIFERFYRVDKSHSREIGGTGLGLAITKNCILMHHGEIKVRSTEGVGTTFDVRVPLNYIEK